MQRLRHSGKTTIVLLLAFVLLYWRCTSPELQIENYEQNDNGDSILLHITGKRLGRLGETKVYLNERELNENYIARWSEGEIELIIKKPLPHGFLQLKKGRKKSVYIPVWDEQLLPEIQRRQKIENLPVLEDYRMLSLRPPIIEIRGQNLGQSVQNQWLLFGRQPDKISGIYFTPKDLVYYQRLQSTQVLSWNAQRIRAYLPQEAAEGPVFLIRPNNEGDEVWSNGLYIPASLSDNRIVAGAGQATARKLLLSLYYPANVLPGPGLRTLSQNSPNRPTSEMKNGAKQPSSRLRSQHNHFCCAGRAANWASTGTTENPQ